MPSAKKSSLQEYLVEAGELPRDVLLGHVVMYSVGDGEYDRTKVVKWFSELDLNPKYIPHENRAVDAYKKATSKVDDYSYTMPNGNTAHVLVRDVSSDKDQVVRHLIREVRDSRQRRLAYDQIGAAVFYRPTVRKGRSIDGTERLRVSLNAPTFVAKERPFAMNLAKRIQEAYDRYTTFMDDMKVRGMFRDYISDLNAVQLRSGVYFVHVSRFDELQRIQELANRMSTDASVNCRVWLMPLVDLEEQREMVVEAFQVETEKALGGVIKRINVVRESRKTITPEAYASIKEEYDRLMKQAVEYTRTLDVSQERTAGAAEVALESLLALQKQMIRDSERVA